MAAQLSAARRLSLMCAELGVPFLYSARWIEAAPLTREQADLLPLVAANDGAPRAPEVA